MNPNDPNVLLLETVARHLDNDLLREVVFIGGAVAGLLITDSAARANGFSLQAGVVAAADERAKLERLCRTITRPAVSTERVSLTAQGLIHYRLKTPYRDGTTHDRDRNLRGLWREGEGHCLHRRFGGDQAHPGASR